MGRGRTLKVKYLTLNPRVALLCFVGGNKGKILNVECGGGLQLCLEDKAWDEPPP